MIYFRRTLFFLFAIAALLTSACAQKKDGGNSSVILQSYRLIDEQRSGEAIILLERELAADPTREDYKVVLASAYAHKGGIKIQKLVPLITQLDRTQNRKAETLQEKDPTLNERINNGVLSIAGLLTHYVDFSKTYSAIPVIEKKQESYILHAIALLNEIGPNIKPEDALYRVILQTVLFKNIMSEGLIGEIGGMKDSKLSTCRVDLGVVNDTVIRLGKLMLDIYSDLQIANPGRKNEMKRLSAEVSESVSQVTIATTAMTVVDEASTIFLKHTVAENGFGKIFKCGLD